MLARSHTLAANAGDTNLLNRTRLQQCALVEGSANSSSGCSMAEVDQAFHAIQLSAVPTEIMEARFARVRVLQGGGNHGQAMNEMSQLIDGMRFFRSALPGVLGGWYWGNRQEVFDDYMALALRRSGANDTAFADGREVLLVLERLKRIASDNSIRLADAEKSAQQDQHDEIRSLLAALNKATLPEDRSRLGRAVSEAVQRSYRGFAGVSPVLEPDSLDAFLNRLPPDSGLLTYCFSGEHVYAITAGQSDVRIRRLSRGGEIVSRLGRLSADLGSPEAMNWADADLPGRLDALGELMLGPVKSALKSTVYLMPLGLLRGFPFDLLRVDNRYLVQQHKVINLMSLSPDARLVAQVSTADTGLIFLAGDPELSRDVFSYEQKRSAEISTVTDLFVGPALHIVQGPALKKDEFDDDRFVNADIIHLSIPTLVNLDDVQRSEMTLSRSGDTTNARLTPDDLPKVMNASLAVLSLTRFQGSESPGYGNHLDFISDLLDAGAGSVVSSLWPLDDESRAKFIAVFYRNLAANPDVAEALYRAKQEWFQPGKSANASIWAGFQLFMR